MLDEGLLRPSLRILVPLQPAGIAGIVPSCCREPAVEAGWIEVAERVPFPQCVRHAEPHRDLDPLDRVEDEELQPAVELVQRQYVLGRRALEVGVLDDLCTVDTDRSNAERVGVWR